MFYINYVALCNKIGKSPSAAAEEMGFKRSVVTRWSKGSTPRQSTLQKVAEYFGITVDELLGKEKQPADGELSDEEKAMLDLFRRASEDSRRLALLALEHGEQH